MKSSFSLDGKTYGFGGVSGNTERWFYSPTGAITGRAELRQQVQLGVANNSALRQNWTLAVPVVVADDSPCGCAGAEKYRNTVGITQYRANEATTADLQDLLDQLDDLVADADWRAAFLNGMLL